MKNAFEKWMDSHSESIERFVFQNGCTPKQAATIAEKVFETVYVNEEAITESLIYVLYQHAIEHMENTVELQESIFPFEEDAALHSEITRLDEVCRVPFVLRQFHQLGYEEIASIVGSSALEVEERAKATKRLLQGDQLDKRLEFLKKSYGRLPVLFNKENVLQEKVAVESEPEVKEQKTKNRNGFITVALLGILLIGLVAGTFFTGEEWAAKSDEKYIERLKKGFAKEVRKKQKVLGFTEEAIKDTDFIKEANDKLDEHILNLEHTLKKGEKIDREMSEEIYEDLLTSIKLPSEYIEELFKNPLTNDAEKSMEFITTYIHQSHVLQDSILQQFIDEFIQLFESGFDEEMDLDVLLSDEAGHPENLRMAIQALLGQNIDPFGTIMAMASLVVEADEKFYERLQGALHESVNGYFLFYEKQPFIKEDQLNYSLEETVEFIVEMETTLQIDYENIDPDMNASLEGTMTWILSYVILGKSDEPLRKADGSISDSYRNAWKQLAAIGNDSPTSVLMAKIIEEMEQSNWTESAMHVYLTLYEYSIHDVYLLAKEGNLTSFVPFTEGVGEMYEAKVTEISNLREDVHHLYEKFSVAYDKLVLKHVHPLLIVGLYDYANEMNNPEMMWHLTDWKKRTLYIEDYTSGWIPQNSLLKQVDFIEFDPSLVISMDDGMSVPIKFLRGEAVAYDVWLSYADDVWQIETIVADGSITTVYP